MSLINQMLQDLDAQEDAGRQAELPEIAAAPVKGRSPWLPGALGMLLVAALSAGVTWVLGQPKGTTAEGEMIPLTLPEPPVASGSRVQSRQLRRIPPEPPARNAGAATPSQAAGRAEVAANTPGKVVGEQPQVIPERPIVRLVAAATPQPEPREIRDGATPSPQQPVLEAPPALGESVSGAADEETAEPETTATKTVRIVRKEKVAPDSLRTAREYIRQGRLAKAEQTLQRTLDANPRMTRVRETLVALLLRGGRRSEAERLLDQGLLLTPGQPVFLSLRARLYREQGDPDRAIALLQQGLGDDPGNGELLELLAVLYQEAERFNEAAAVYRRILKQRPGSAKSWAGLAISLEALEEREPALQAYGRALVGGRLPAEVADYVQQRVSVLESR